MSVPWFCLSTSLSSAASVKLVCALFFILVCTLFSVLLVDYACIAAGLFPWLLFWILEFMYYDFPQKADAG